jgi:hypothetical protein
MRRAYEMCPFCLDETGRPMGRRGTKSKGRVQQWRCIRCRRWRSRSTEPYHYLFPGRRYRLPAARLLQALALLVLGLPMEWIQKMVRVKAETIRKHFQDLVRTETWGALKPSLLGVGVPQALLQQFDAEVEECRFGVDSFRGRGQRFRQMKASQRRQLVLRASRVLKRRVSL